MKGKYRNPAPRAHAQAGQRKDKLAMSWRTTALLIFLFGARGLWTALSRTQESPPEIPPLVTGKTITPQGTQTNVGSFPANMILSPDGEYLIVTNTGYREFLSVLSTKDGHLVSQVEIGKEADK